MPSLIAKILIGGVASVGSAGSVFIANRLLSPSNIKEKLESEGYRILSTTRTESDETNDQHDYSKWKEIISKWTENSNHLANFVVKNAEENNDNTKINALKEKCEETLKSPVDQERYENAKKYCAVENTPKQ